MCIKMRYCGNGLTGKGLNRKDLFLKYIAEKEAHFVFPHYGLKFNSSSRLFS